MMLSSENTPARNSSKVCFDFQSCQHKLTKTVLASLVTREWAKTYAEIHNMDVSLPVHEVAA
jgi:hypothetical protein